MSEQMKGERQDNTPAPERVSEVGKMIRGLMKMVEDDKLQEVESAQPENLHPYELKDAAGNGITYIRNNAGHLEHPIEVRDPNGKLIAQSWDGRGWSIDRYIENGVDFQV